ncbi:MAG: phytanoyl-CoA dioxygenase family protein [Candidatus Puniceispirillales bacterium]|jgi:ectoine hydroxylase-related dioxygenase (phytanoyl-CoA dioxygenase family)|tara:strand:- start:3118 stop:3987 length:870 start_codon:yes stop_codon:yes gene_type:complete
MQDNHLKIKDYWKNGFLFPINIFTQNEASKFREELEAIENRYKTDLSLPMPINTYKRINSQCVIPLATDIALDRKILDIVEKIIGENILLWSVEFFIKEPGSSSIVSMHQDLTYWGLSENEFQVTAWVALSPSNKKSGCMDFVTESFKNPILPHKDTFGKDNLLSRGQEIEVNIKESDKVNIVLNPGQMSLHHGLTIHGSGKNNSNDRRIGVAIRYLNPKIKQVHAEKDFAILARGKDKFNNFIKYDPPKKLFSKKDLELHKKIREYQKMALSRNTSGVKMFQGNDNVV